MRPGCRFLQDVFRRVYRSTDAARLGRRNVIPGVGDPVYTSSALATRARRLRCQVRRRMYVRLSIFAVALASAPFAGAVDAPILDRPADMPEAQQLFEAKRYPEAHAALAKLVAADPKNAAACHLLGRVLSNRNDRAAAEEGLTWLGRAAELAPENVGYLSAFGIASLRQAGRATSLAAATRGRDALEKVLRLDPAQLDAREALYQFYQRAPWPLGSAAKANAHLQEIRSRAPDRAVVIEVQAKAAAKDFPAAFQLCETALATAPDNFSLLYQLGRLSSQSGLNLERGLACLQRCLTLTAPPGTGITPAQIWVRIGNVEEKREQVAAARVAYATAARLEPENRQAADALARLQ